MMEKLLILILSVTVQHSLQSVVPVPNITARYFIYNQYKYDTAIRVPVNSSTEQILDFYEDSDKWHGHPSRVHVSSKAAITSEYPLFITATQQKGVASWELPMVIQTKHSVIQFQDMARTLCPHDAGPNITSVNRPLITLSTSSPSNVSVDIKLRRVLDFFVQLDKVVNATVTPSTPKYYYFSFDTNPVNDSVGYGGFPRFNYSIPKSVLLIIESDDDVCAVVSIQNNSCPVFDNEKDMLYQGTHLTMTQKGGITITQSMFPTGFYIVLIVKQSDEECTGASETTVPHRVGAGLRAWVADGRGDGGRMKSFRFRLVAALSYEEYVIGVVAMLALALSVAAFVVLLNMVTCHHCEVLEVPEAEVLPAPSTSQEDATMVTEGDRKDSESLTDSEPPEWAASLPRLTVNQLYRARPAAHVRRTNRYFWSALTVAVVYALPVVQLLSTYQNMVFQTGDQDLCYYNFLCAHPLLNMSDFSHVFSNACYVILGIAFMCQVRTRQLAGQRGQNMGIPQHSGLLYSLGLALVMEGVLSACYHLCPNKMNFQFDSSFMYVIAVLGMVKLYQNRHPDVNASAHSTFMVIAAIMTIGLIGIMYPSVYFWVAFTVVHLGTCFILTINIYYVGRLKLESRSVLRAWSAVTEHGRRALVPNYVARAVLLALANAANWALATYGLYEHNKDFARHLLAILMGNTILYTLFYICMKLVHRERILFRTWVCLVLAHVAWFGALRLFLDSKTKWSETPALSRRHNAVCTALSLYDSHDLWHAASAAALYLSFNVLLTVDDALIHVPTDLIAVF